MLIQESVDSVVAEFYRETIVAGLDELPCKTEDVWLVRSPIALAQALNCTEEYLFFLGREVLATFEDFLAGLAAGFPVLKTAAVNTKFPRNLRHRSAPVWRINCTNSLIKRSVIRHELIDLIDGRVVEQWWMRLVAFPWIYSKK